MPFHKLLSCKIFAWFILISKKAKSKVFFIDKQKLVIIRYGKRTWLLHLIYEISTEITILEVNRNGGT